jgi:trimethylamine---corrinoid protein Co-methyltransferase
MAGLESAGVPLSARRTKLITHERAERIHRAALKILDQVGLEVLSEDLLACLAKEGFRVRGSRVHIEPHVAEEYVAEMRKELVEARPAVRQDTGRLTLGTMIYSHHYLDLETDQISVFTERTLAQMTRLIDSYADEGLRGSVPGYPLDAPGPLQPLIRYRIAAENAGHGVFPHDLPSAATAHFVLDMADVMGHPIRSLPVYTHTPLRVGGQSLKTLLANLQRVDSIRVSNMPAAGANAPILPIPAFALSAAELIGTAIALKVFTGKPTSFYVQVFPFDLRSTFMVFGTPEDLLYNLASTDLNLFYGHDTSNEGSDIVTMAGLPGPQAAADKMAILTAGAVCGARHFGCAGTTILGEVFSPEQLLFDLEIRDWVQRLINGLDMTDLDDELLAEISAGLDGGYWGQPSTVANYRRLYWYPKRFERISLEAWQAAGGPSFKDDIRDEVHARIAGHTFQLDDERRRALERIYQDATAQVTGH